MLNRANIISFSAGAFGALVILGVFALISPRTPASISEKQALNLGRFVSTSSPQGASFVEASAAATPAVVHIKSSVEARQRGGRGSSPQEDMFFPFREFFEEPHSNLAPGASTGSGVVITEDGYIVTNNHVIDEASKVEVVLSDNRSYTATVIGTDPSTDLALLKINEKGLPFLKFGDSDKVQVGEWVLAVGNPFNLTSTVTAGIVSAKGRNIGILPDKFKIESFIQTDAAVNPGNSGGALINTNGDLIGINTAIATRTGTYNGYSFAVPVTIVRKIVDDLLKFGEVQRGFLGIQIQDVNGSLAEQKSLKTTRGVFVAQINDKGAAQEAGIKEGDVIIKIDGVTINTSSELQEQVSRHRPGDQIKVTLMRDGSERIIPVTLKNKAGTTKLSSRESNASVNSLGAELEKLSEEDKRAYKARHGVKITRLYAGKLRSSGIPDDFVITHIDKTPVYTPQDVVSQLEGKEGGVLVEGLLPGGKKEVFAIMF